MLKDPDSRPPRGAIIVVVIGLVATLAAAVLANENLSGEATQLEWERFEDVADSKPVKVPGSDAEMELSEAGLRSTGTNVSGYNLFRGAATLRIDAGAPVGGGRIRCSMSVPRDTEVAQTPDLRATYPRSSDELDDQPIPEVLLVEFSSKGNGLAVVDAEDLPGFFATQPGIKIEWPDYELGVERWKWYLPPGPPKVDLELPFYSVWRSTRAPAVEIACTLTTSAGEATVSAAGAIDQQPPPIDEEEDA